MSMRLPLFWHSRVDRIDDEDLRRRSDADFRGDRQGLWAAIARCYTQTIPPCGPPSPQLTAGTSAVKNRMAT